MSTALPTEPITTEQFLALPDDGHVERELIQGTIWERPMTTRNPWHTEAEANLAQLLGNWRDAHPELACKVHSGEAAFRLRTAPDSIVGTDVAVAPAALPRVKPKKGTAFLDGPPVLAVEILSSSDDHEGIVNKVRAYLDAGVPLVWIVDPDFRYVIAHRPDAEPELFNVRQELTAEPALPGFRAPVARIFGL
jgi:Uma2 family endonuclease